MKYLILSWGQAGPSASMERKLPNVGVYILNQLGVRKLRQCRFPVWSCKV